LVYCTLANNFVQSSPANSSGGIVISANATARMSACVLTGAANANVVGKLIDDGNNLSSDSSAAFTAATSRNNVDPKLGEFGNHGGATPTVALLPGSPAIDAVSG